MSGSRVLLRPAILVLLRERHDHGYSLMERLGQAGLGRMDPAGVYRALRVLEEEGSARSWWTSAERGAPRRVYALTSAGERQLGETLRELDHQRSTVTGLLQRGRSANFAPRSTSDHRPSDQGERLLHLA